MIIKPHSKKWPAALMRSNLYQAIRRLGFAGNLQVCLDAGDVVSYDGTSQTWTDLTANGFSFFRGATGVDTTPDPTFNGTAGNRSSSEYFSLDAGDYFTYDTTNEAWMQRLHQDSAIFAMAWWMQKGAAGVIQGLFGTMGATSNTGIRLTITAAERVQVQVRNAGNIVLSVQGSASLLVPLNTWSMIGFSMNEAEDGAELFINGVAEEVSGATYTLPAAGNASFAMQIGATGNAVSPLTNTSRIAAFAAWEGTDMGGDDFQALFQATRGKFNV